MSTDMCETFGDAILTHRSYVQWTAGSPADSKVLHPDIDPITIAHQYRILRLGYGRKNGKSMYIARGAGPSDMIICPDHDELELMIKRTEAIGGSGVCTRIYCVTDDLDRDPNRLEIVDTVWIDSASTLDPARLETLIRVLSPRTSHFIFMG